MTEHDALMTDIPPVSPRAPRSWRPALIMSALFFVGGIGLTGWFLTSTHMGVGLLQREAPSPLPIDATQLNQAPPSPPAADETGRLAALEARMARLETTATTGGAAPSNGRFNALILAFAARRALERGQPLGPIEDELRVQFGANQPHLLAAVVAAANKPTTLEQIKSEFATVAPSLLAKDEGIWSRLTSAFSGLASVRSADTRSKDPAQLLDHAQKAVEAGRVADAITDVAAMPNRAEASEWLAKARRYTDAQAALDALEASAFSAVPPVQIVPPAPVPAPAPVAPPESSGSSATF
jgi:hypothetical protein